jgi:hypothetical protein
MSRAQLVRVMHGVSKLGLLPNPHWLQCFYDRAESAPGTFQVSGFGMVLWGLAKVGAKPHPAWLASLVDSTYGWGDSTVAAAAGGDGGGGGGGLAVAAEAARGSASGAATDTAAAAAAAAPPLQQQLRPQHLTNMLCAFAKLGFTPGGRWMAWFRAELGRASVGGQLQELDHFHIEWSWKELNQQYRLATAAAGGSGGGGVGGGSSEGSRSDPAAAAAADEAVQQQD